MVVFRHQVYFAVFWIQLIVSIATHAYPSWYTVILVVLYGVLVLVFLLNGAFNENKDMNPREMWWSGVAHFIVWLVLLVFNFR